MSVWRCVVAMVGAAVLCGCQQMLPTARTQPVAGPSNDTVRQEPSVSPSLPQESVKSFAAMRRGIQRTALTKEAKDGIGTLGDEGTIRRLCADENGSIIMQAEGVLELTLEASEATALSISTFAVLSMRDTSLKADGFFEFQMMGRVEDRNFAQMAFCPGSRGMIAHSFEGSAVIMGKSLKAGDRFVVTRNGVEVIPAEQPTTHLGAGHISMSPAKPPLPVFDFSLIRTAREATHRVGTRCVPLVLDGPRTMFVVGKGTEFGVHAAVEVNGTRHTEKTSTIESSLLAFPVGTGEQLRFTDGDVVWNVGPRTLSVQQIELRTGECAVCRDGKLAKATTRLLPPITP